MAFVDEYGQSYINDEHKVRIGLSARAKLVMVQDMEAFGITTESTFINTVFSNYKMEAKSSISTYLEQHDVELDSLLDSAMDIAGTGRENVLEVLHNKNERDLREMVSQFTNAKSTSKLYHINLDNVTFLEEESEENHYYSRPGLYMRAVIEEYCSLPFIKRERIFRKDVYEAVERAIEGRNVLKVKAEYNNVEMQFYVYPYKIVPDTLHSQSYLVCYSRKTDQSDKDKIIASFSMAKLKKPTTLTKNFYLNKAEIAELETQIERYSPAFLIDKHDQIKVKLTEAGKRSYKSRLYSRPEKIESLSTKNIYVFNCSHQQIFNYFMPFGANAEIISPEDLRQRFKDSLEKALKVYE